VLKITGYCGLPAKQVSITFTMKGNLIYIVKPKHKTHQPAFTGTSKMQKYKPEVFPQLQYEETGSELIALLKKAVKNKINKPITRPQRKAFFNWLYAKR
jgi:DNA polymerase-3 subunit epsilon